MVKGGIFPLALPWQLMISSRKLFKYSAAVGRRPLQIPEMAKYRECLKVVVVDVGCHYYCANFLMSRSAQDST